MQPVRVRLSRHARAAATKSLKQPARPVALEVQLLGMALHPDDEAPSRVLDRFDEAVVRACA